MRDFRDLVVWQKAHKMTLAVYHCTFTFPQEEKYGLISQLRRAVSSIPVNIAEGCGRNSDKEFVRFLQIAFGSASETEYALLLCKDLGYLATEEYERVLSSLYEVKKMLATLITKINSELAAKEYIQE